MYMASTTRTAAALVKNGTMLGQGTGERTDVLHTVDVVTCILVISLLVPLMFLKIYIKTCIAGACGREDRVCLFAWLMTTAYCVTGLLMARHGGGNHEWELPTSELIAFQKILYADTILYGPAAFLTKTTLLLIVTRVFSHTRRAVLFVYVFIGLMACYYLPVLFLKIRLCTPIEGLWDPLVDSMCFNQQSIFFTDAIVSVVTDVVVLLLPLPLVFTLKVNLWKKLRIAALLGAGGIATIASVCRAILVWSPHAYNDITVTFVRINLLGIAEVGLGIICACIPTFNILFTRYTKERRGAKSNSEYRVTGKQSPASRTRRLTGDAKCIHVWRKGHRYKKSFGSEVDELGADNFERESRAIRGDEVEDSETGQGKWKSTMKLERDVESEAGSEVVMESGSETAVESDTETGHGSDRESGRQRQRERAAEEDAGWPLSAGGGNVLPINTNEESFVGLAK